MDALYLGAMVALAVITWVLLKLCEFLGDR